MKFFVSFLLIILLVYTAYLFNDVLPWWGFTLGAFIGGWVVPQKAFMSWLAGFSGVFLCWAVVVWFIDHDNHGIMSHRMAGVLGLPPSSTTMILITALLGAIVGGFAALTGAFLRKKPLTTA